MAEAFRPGSKQWDALFPKGDKGPSQIERGRLRISRLRAMAQTKAHRQRGPDFTHQNVKKRLAFYSSDPDSLNGAESVVLANLISLYGIQAFLLRRLNKARNTGTTSDECMVESELEFVRNLIAGVRITRQRKRQTSKSRESGFDAHNAEKAKLVDSRAPEVKKRFRELKESTRMNKSGIIETLAEEFDVSPSTIGRDLTR